MWFGDGELVETANGNTLSLSVVDRDEYSCQVSNLAGNGSGNIAILPSEYRNKKFCLIIIWSRLCSTSRYEQGYKKVNVRWRE